MSAAHHLEIKCRCGHTFARHAESSPHGCVQIRRVGSDENEPPGMSSGVFEHCACERFQAAEPVWSEP